MTSHLKFKYTPSKYVCSQAIDIELSEDGTISSIAFEGGCPGNLEGIACLVKGMKAEDVINRLEGIMCDDKPTSCPDQLAKALREYLSIRRR